MDLIRNQSAYMPFEFNNEELSMQAENFPS